MVLQQRLQTLITKMLSEPANQESSGPLGFVPSHPTFFGGQPWRPGTKQQCVSILRIASLAVYFMFVARGYKFLFVTVFFLRGKGVYGGFLSLAVK